MDKNFILAFDNGGNTHYVNLKYVVRAYVVERYGNNGNNRQIMAQLETGGRPWLLSLANYPSREKAQKSLEEIFNNFTCERENCNKGFSNKGFQVVGN